MEWVFDYLQRHAIHFHITRERRTKLGDYRRPANSSSHHEISVNGDLNPYFFLWVFLHEAAHLETHLKYRAVQPHGHEWQEEYRQLLIAHADLFPTDLQPLLKKYTHRIPLLHSAGKQIESLLHHYDADYNPNDVSLSLDNLQPGDRFSLKQRPWQTFEALVRRRTRWLCRDLDSGRQYLVNGSAQITKH